MLKNYTSSVPIDRTLARIEAVLVKAGATNVMKDYKDGELVALSFVVRDPQSQKPLAIRLPANVEAVYVQLAGSVRKPRAGTLEKLREQAARTAWKLMQDWVEVQMSLIELQQVELLQVFLPYVWNGKQTFYESLKGSGFKGLTDQRGKETGAK